MGPPWARRFYPGASSGGGHLRRAVVSCGIINIGGIALKKYDCAASALVWTILAGIAGVCLGALLNLEGYLGVIFAIAVAAWHIVKAIEEKDSSSGNSGADSL